MLTLSILGNVQKLSDSGKLSLLQEMYREWPFMQVPLCMTDVCLHLEYHVIRPT
jgi:phosphoenolpyruvate carboxylase